MRNVAWLILGISLLACGGVAAEPDPNGPGGGGGGTGGGSSGGTPPTPPGGPLDPVGSFGLTVSDVDVTFSTVDSATPGSPPPVAEPPSRTVKSRLDIRKSPTNPNAFDAVFTG